MPLQTIHLEYDLSRRQRWDAYIGGWLPALPRYLFVAGVMAGLTWLASHASAWFLLFYLAPLWVLRGLIAGILNIVFIPVQHMDIVMNEDALGYLAGGARWWVHLDSIVRIERFRDDLWSFGCYHGERIDVPVSLLGDEALAHIRAKMEWARTPEGMQAAVNRGRRVLGLKVPAHGEGSK